MKLKHILKLNKYTLFIYLFILLFCAGATYAYFAFRVEEEAVLVGDAVGINVDLDVELVVGSNDEMVPLKYDALSNALNGVGSENGACVDDLGNLSCQVYKITLINYGSRVRHVNGTIELYAKDGEGNVYNNLKWIELESPTTVKSDAFVNGMSKSTLISNLTIESKAVGIWYVAVWINEIDGDQKDLDKGEFGGIVKFESDIMVGDGLVENLLERNAENDIYLEFSKTSEESGTNGIYVKNDTANDGYPIYYWRGNVDNNLIFADHCWKMVRTTETGGLKLLYSGVPNNGKCNNVGDATIIGKSKYNLQNNSLAYTGYMYNDDYVTFSKNMSSGTFSFANDVVYDDNNGVYNFVDDSDDSDDVITSNWSSVYNNGLANNHYFCFDTGGTSCSTVGYIFSTKSSTAYYIKLSNGNKIENALDSMLGADNELIDTYNSKSCTIKGDKDTPNTIDWWYYNNIEEAGYKSYLEDTVWCNDRRILDKAGFNPNGGNTISSSYVTFQVLDRTWHTFEPTLECARKVDSFTVDDTVNGNGKLDYPIGLLTPDEIMLAGGKGGTTNDDYYLYSEGNYWSSAANNFYNNMIVQVYVNSDGFLNGSHINSTNIGIRPAISLKHGYVINSGTGKADSPFIVDAPPILDE